MNLDAIPLLRDWKELPAVSPAARLVLWVLAAWEHKDAGTCFCFNGALARATGFSRRRMTDARAELLRAGLLVMVEGANSERSTPTYRLGAALRGNGRPVLREVTATTRARRPRTVAPEVEAAFTQFWDAYPAPRRKDRKRALGAWIKASPNPPMVERILAALRVQVASADWKRENFRFVPLPKTYINGARWEDAVEPETGGPAPRTLPDTTAWRQQCQHSPACRSAFEHEATIDKEDRRATA